MLVLPCDPYVEGGILELRLQQLQHIAAPSLKALRCHANDLWHLARVSRVCSLQHIDVCIPGSQHKHLVDLTETERNKEKYKYTN